jgi:2-polyprenyl-3-methyl-5-hydroxy-6-metoxy-1,4-benzoquinol methylase
MQSKQLHKKTVNLFLFYFFTLTRTHVKNGVNMIRGKISNPICSNERNDFLELQKTLYSSRNPTRRWLHNRRKKWVENAIIEHSGKGLGTVLEIGPGSGVYLPLLTAHFATVVVSDIEESFLRNTAHFNNGDMQVKCVLDDITRTNLPPESFDLVLCSEVIEHLQDPEAALRNIKLILKKNGLLILSTPNKYSTLEVCSKAAYLPGVIEFVRFVYGESILNAEHISLITRNNLQNLLNTTGFIIEKHETFGCYLPMIAEFFGNFGLRIEKKMERCLMKTPLEGLLWTQAYILLKNEPDETY